MRPLRFPAPPSSLLGLDRAPAAFAGLSGDVGKVIFPRMLVAWGEVGIGKLSAFARDIALLWCVSGGHLQSFPGPVAKSSRCAIQHRTDFAMVDIAPDPDAPASWPPAAEEDGSASMSRGPGKPDRCTLP